MIREIAALAFLLLVFGFTLCAIYLSQADSAVKIEDLIDICGEDAVRVCPTEPSIRAAVPCLLRHAKDISPSCAYLIQRRQR